MKRGVSLCAALVIAAVGREARAEPQPPAGYHWESSTNLAATIGGVAAFLPAWSISLAFAGLIGTSEVIPLGIPGIGPFIQIPVIHAASGGGSGLGWVDAVLVVDGIVQCTGIALFAFGLAKPTRELVRDGEARVVPMGPNGTPGLSFVGSF